MSFSYQQNNTLCNENPTSCSFSFSFYEKGAERTSCGLEQHVLIFCKKGHIRIMSNLFKEEFLCAGEILFVPRGSDYHGVALSDVVLLVHYFSNTVCHVENCLLSFLYTHKHVGIQPEKTYYFRKLSVCGQLTHLMDGVGGYLNDQIHEPALWGLKHKELIWLFTKYYTPEELRLFFHSMTDEDVPFKSLVLAHYRKAEYTDTLAEMCGYPLHTFRRLFKSEFKMSAHKWLTMKRAEHVLHRLSLPYIPFTDIIDEFRFSSPQQFTRFCKDNLGDTPSNLRIHYAITESVSNFVQK
ncbi:helix-turn-helix domain-containing protein [Parabacteroides faecis]|uniref:helix-turn-helix domain-containing protein n=1 Tax=Parabacteroides faecis TaxID=1217282 RepID=UPI00216464D9|nr:helix-turn-helix domain-containing protein [Parabacteroides faecis]MCS2893544.1 helix-turn-helix domain-containing protein [Parabacteroides faecis]UVQ47860.1 helix-turn-helix domain-containing protein [Parabacteroides faecis]